MMRYMMAALMGLMLLSGAATAQAQAAAQAAPDPIAVEQLRHAIGTWEVETDFIDTDGKILGSAKGTYVFKWVLPDRIVSGTSTIPAWRQTSAILFFVRPKTSEVEMASVGSDGVLWQMIGPDSSETRTTPNVAMDDGSTMMLRFTRHSVTPDSFGSTMEMSVDGGESWHIANQQRFVRKKEEGAAEK
ncbi:hypothetical protein [Sphingorhabdus sp. Alg239-R122]|uniref:hypothetical protein n=1 Tax=Sphingorhabdus sp. Alg239-R122 TaxID=2305989 RepID=UPI0013D9ED80|nr:hypothetical protein [Sphingorhabdus sp. Alg239-R122]